MRKSLSMQRVILTAVFFLLFLMVIGCSGKASLETQISGSWQRTEDNGTVEINLIKDPKSLIIDGHSYKASVEKIEKGSHSALVKVELDAGKTEVWSIQQVWNDNGSAFKLAFRHNGTKETLVPAKRS